MYAVIDTETTGLIATKDRIIELAVIGLDEEGRKEWEWCSLINPERNTGNGLAIRVHQIYSSDVANAPLFSDLAGHISELLKDRVVIAHNSQFDIGMLASEFARLGFDIPTVPNVCTVQLARECGFPSLKLGDCCASLGIEMEGMHHALADARAAYALAREILDFSHDGIRKEFKHQLRNTRPWPEIQTVSTEQYFRPIAPSRGGASQTRNVQELSSPKTPSDSFTFDKSNPEHKYLAAIELALEDRVISEKQGKALKTIRDAFGMSSNQVHDIHMLFVRGLAGSMWSDGVISPHERFDLEIVVDALELTETDLKHALENPIKLDLIHKDYEIKPDSRVVFTGEMSLSRGEWTEKAKAAGLRVTGSVSKKTDFLVVPYNETGSSKSIKARDLGVRVVSEQRFIRMFNALENQ